MKEIGTITKWMVMESTQQLMSKFMKGTGKKISLLYQEW